jgi:hypothetical protein
MKLDRTRISGLIEAAVRAESELPEAVARDVAFHMTDWLDDLESYYDFCAHPERLSPAEIDKLLIDFLLHVPNHIAAASKLLTGMAVTDIFGVGSTTEEEG